MNLYQVKLAYSSTLVVAANIKDAEKKAIDNLPEYLNDYQRKEEVLSINLIASDNNSELTGIQGIIF